jgi:hypothetical protein
MDKEAYGSPEKTDNLIATYYGKVKAISDGIVATRFYQI